MKLRSRKQTTPQLKLEITENFTEKRALRKRHERLYRTLIKTLQIVENAQSNEIIPEDSIWDLQKRSIFMRKRICRKRAGFRAASNVMK